MSGIDALAVWMELESGAQPPQDAWHLYDSLPTRAFGSVRHARTYRGIGGRRPYFALYEAARDAALATDDITARAQSCSAAAGPPHPARRPALAIKHAVGRGYVVLSAVRAAPCAHVITVGLRPVANRMASVRAWLASEAGEAFAGIRGLASLMAYEADAGDEIIRGTGTVLRSPAFLVVCEVTEPTIEMSLARLWADRALAIGAETAVTMYESLHTSGSRASS